LDLRLTQFVIMPSLHSYMQQYIDLSVCVLSNLKQMCAQGRTSPLVRNSCFKLIICLVMNEIRVHSVAVDHI